MTNIIIVAVAFLVLMLLGVPVAFAMGIPCIAWVLLLRDGMPIMVIPQNIMSYMLSFTLISMPGFLFVGRMMYLPESPPARRYSAQSFLPAPA